MREDNTPDVRWRKLVSTNLARCRGAAPSTGIPRLELDPQQASHGGAQRLGPVPTPRASSARHHSTGLEAEISPHIQLKATVHPPTRRGGGLSYFLRETAHYDRHARSHRLPPPRTAHVALYRRSRSEVPYGARDEIPPLAPLAQVSLRVKGSVFLAARSPQRPNRPRWATRTRTRRACAHGASC